MLETGSCRRAESLPGAAMNTESLIVVDADDRTLHPASREECHAGEGLLHRAFSVYLFDDENRLLLQERQAGKTLWPGYWANSCCSHPRWGEDVEDAAHRRVAEELGLEHVRIAPLFRYRYQALFGDAGAEHELCWVYVGRVEPERVRPNPAEVADTRLISASELDREIQDADRYTPWLRIAWGTIRRAHWPTIERI